MILLQRQATVASTAKNTEALGFADQVTNHIRSVFPDNDIKYWLQIGGVFATIHWTMEFRDMADFEQVLTGILLDEQYATMLAQASDCWLPGSTKDTLLRGF